MLFSNEGDGTVPVNSLSFVSESWKKNNSNVSTTIVKEGDIEHRGILKNNLVIQRIITEATDGE